MPNMQFRVVPAAGKFLVLDAATANVARTLLLQQGRRVPWLVLRDHEKYFVFSAKEVAAGLESAKPTVLLAAALQLHRAEPSIVLRSSMARVDLDQNPVSGTTASRVVILKKSRIVHLAVSAIGILKLYVQPAVAEKTTALVKKRAPGKTEIHGRGRAIRPPATRVEKKYAAYKKLAPVRKAPPKNASGGGPAREFSLGFGFSRPRRITTTPAVVATHSFSAIDVFYATDRELKLSNSSNTTVRYLNRLPVKGEFDYGICSVTIPDGHVLGKIESPSIWSFQIREDPQKHFTIRGCARRSASVFFKEVQSRVDESNEKSC
jgi:hypothetical protein